MFSHSMCTVKRNTSEYRSIEVETQILHLQKGVTFKATIVGLHSVILIVMNPLK